MNGIKKVQLLTDNRNSWIVPYVDTFARDLCDLARKNCSESESQICVKHIFLHTEIESGDVLVLLGCEKILPPASRKLNRVNLVIHESALPEGRGWSPLTWQILEGKNRIPVSLFEAGERVDDGPVYNQTVIELDGTELVDEIREKQAHASFALISQFISQYPKVQSQQQSGAASYYPKRGPDDSKLSPDKTIAEQFDLLRVADPKRYPAFFEFRGCRYKLKIEKIS